MNRPRPLPQKKEPTESEILTVVRDFLRLRGWFVIRNQQGLGSHLGMADLTAIKNGKVIFVEVKTPKGRLGEYQRKFKRDIEEHGGIYLVVRSVEELEKALNKEVS